MVELAETEDVFGEVQRVLSQEERPLRWLSRRTGIPYQRLYGLRHGKAVELRRAEAEAIARALGLPEEQLFRGVTIYPDDPWADVVGRRLRRRRAHKPVTSA